MATFELIIRGELDELPGIAAALNEAAPQVLGGDAEITATLEPTKATRRTKKTDAPTPVEVFAGPQNNGAGSATEASSGQDTTQGSTTLTSATGQTVGSTASPSDAGAVTYDTLKDLMTEVLKKHSASVAQATLREATGGSSLSGLTPDQYPAAHAALTAALAK